MLGELNDDKGCIDILREEKYIYSAFVGGVLLCHGISFQSALLHGLPSSG